MSTTRARKRKRTTALNEKERWDAAAGRLLLAEFVRVVTRSRLVAWTRMGEDDDEERFEAALDTGTCADLVARRGRVAVADLEIMVRRGKVAVSWYGEDDDELAYLEAPIDAELYAEVEESCRASASENMQVAVIRRGAAPTMRPYGPADDDVPTAEPTS
jgi:hypothetical protein